MLAIGPEVYGVTAPFGLLRDHVPGFSGIRVSARLAVVAWLTPPFSPARDSRS